jgi:hypothetical protein
VVCTDSGRAEAARTPGYGEALIHEECFRRKLKTEMGLQNTSAQLKWANQDVSEKRSLFSALLSILRTILK